MSFAWQNFKGFLPGTSTSSSASIVWLLPNSDVEAAREAKRSAKKVAVNFMVALFSVCRSSVMTIAGNTTSGDGEGVGD